MSYEYKQGIMICSDCEKTYTGGPKSFYCPACRRKRLSEAARGRGLNKLGYEAYSKKVAEKRKRNG